VRQVQPELLPGSGQNRVDGVSVAALETVPHQKPVGLYEPDGGCIAWPRLSRFLSYGTDLNLKRPG
jgi:hypothetical protein